VSAPLRRPVSWARARSSGMASTMADR